ncbi:winged helix-turn-helix transcriptional regulator [Halobaculum rubrum]|uniref:winged helix-turn-helix transcriptional regulator n=1 Tax=Halobaculum rubrum TaxID=2872158 RepID=UPI001CA41FCC|nr:winged helix-turn-helix transcriptional regulator [Halobaculum rubrum]QZX99812.1 winged helix-turn-helix transcriptional regulator [Halobaculum rubrum]QZX99849.1 winged helix-turn-helix transcriptional regulator [Halobaculum rubrum]
MASADLQKKILETLEQGGEMKLSEVVDKIDGDNSELRDAMSELATKYLVDIDNSGRNKTVRSRSPVPISKLAFRGDLSPTQAIIRYLYEEGGYGQTEIARMIGYSPGNVQTNIKRIEKKIGRELRQEDSTATD